MDYRNADGSIAEMCGNGVRVFVRYLVDEGLAYGPAVSVATRAGLREAQCCRTAGSGWRWVRSGASSPGPVIVRGRQAAPPSRSTSESTCGELYRRSGRAGCGRARLSADAFPDGVNAEFVRRLGERHLAMRVFERGSGETRSCGTGTVAAAAAAGWLRRCPPGRAEPATYRVDVLGGTVEVELGEQAYLTGPAVLVALARCDADSGRERS